MADPDELQAAVAARAGADLAARVRFALELDRLRLVERQSYLGGGARREDTASHSWHVAAMALALGPALGEGVDLDRVVQLLVVHDIVEIDAGDVGVYDPAHADKAPAEQAAADRLYGLLPGGTGERLRALWDEFEARATPEARLAAGLDRLAPLLLNWLSEGRTWRENGVHAGRVRAVNVPVAAAASPALVAVVEAVIDDAVRRGWLPPDPDPDPDADPGAA